MQLITYRWHGGTQRLGVVSKDLLVDIERLGAARGTAMPQDMLGLIDNGATVLPFLKDVLTEYGGKYPVGSALPLEDVTVLAPIPKPRKNIFGIGLNYR